MADHGQLVHRDYAESIDALIAERDAAIAKASQWEERWDKAAGQRDKAREKVRALEEELERERGSWAQRIMMQGLEAMASDIRSGALAAARAEIEGLAVTAEAEAEKEGRDNPTLRTIKLIRAQGLREALAVIEEAQHREQS